MRFQRRLLEVRHIVIVGSLVLLGAMAFAQSERQGEEDDLLTAVKVAEERNRQVFPEIAAVEPRALAAAGGNRRPVCRFPE
jgi:hypothetical protein